MQKGDDHQQYQSLTSDYSTATLLFNPAAASCSDGPNFYDIEKVLSQVELPSPSPTLATSCGLHDGQASGTKMVDAIEGMEKEVKDIHENLQESGMKFQAQETRGAKQRQRNRLIQEKIRTLKELIPNCNKKDKASILDDAIMYTKSLQIQVQINQMMQMGAGTMPQGLFMSPGRHPSLQGPYLAPYFMMRPMNGVGNMGQYGSYFNSIPPAFPPLGSCFHSLVPPIRLPIPSGTIFASSQIGPGISSQSPYHIYPSDNKS